MNIIIEEDALKDIEKLSNKERIFSKLEESEKEPYRFFKRLKGKKEYKLRIGDIRIIAEINNEIITIKAVGHRRNIYEKYFKLKEVFEKYEKSI